MLFDSAQNDTCTISHPTDSNSLPFLPENVATHLYIHLTDPESDLNDLIV